MDFAVDIEYDFLRFWNYNIFLSHVEIQDTRYFICPFVSSYAPAGVKHLLLFGHDTNKTKSHQKADFS